VELELKGITKRFGSLVANDRIDLSVSPGQVHALLGENGAGKSTLMNVLYGLLQPDEGEILLDGKKVQFTSPKDAIAAGIGMVHQHFMLVPVFTVAENVTLGMEETRPSGLLDRRKARRDVRELSRRYGLEVDPDALVENLPVGIQQRVEIIKALVRDASVLILDEPTAVLTPAEAEDLFRIIRQLKDGGTSIVFISHKLKEVQEIADTITVLRRGAVVGQESPSATEDQLAALMVGRNVQLKVDKDPAKPGEVVLDVEDLTVADETGRVWVNEMSFQVRAGEILGLAGVQGNGQTELCEALLGLRPIASGHIRLDGRDLTHSTPRQRLHAGVAYVPEDRQEDGLVGAFSVADNMILDNYDRPPFASGINLHLGAIASNAAERVEEFDVRTQSADTPVGTTVMVTVDRDGKAQTFKLTIQDRTQVFADEEQVVGSRRQREDPVKPEAEPGKFGIGVRPASDQEKSASGAKQGVVVTRVETSSFADDIGLAEKDVITSINRKPVTSREDIVAIQKTLKAGDPVVFRVVRQLGSRNIQTSGAGRYDTQYLSGTLPEN